MARNKPYTAPFWWIIVIIFLRVVLTAMTIISLRGLLRRSTLYSEEFVHNILKTQLITNSIFVALLVAEAIIYWRIRKRITRTDFANLHIVGLLLTFVILPLLIMLYTVWASITHRSDANISQMTGNIRMVLFYSVLALAHLFFVMMLIDTHKKHKAAMALKQSGEESKDMLNEFADQ